MFYQKGVLRNFAKFAGKHLCQSLFFNKVPVLRPATTKEEALTQVSSYEFCEISKKTYFTEHLWATASNNSFKLSYRSAIISCTVTFL